MRRGFSNAESRMVNEYVEISFDFSTQVYRIDRETAKNIHTGEELYKILYLAMKGSAV